VSDLLIEVCEVSEVFNHPDADRLDVVKVKGWEVITQRGAYSVGDPVVYFPPDTLLPDKYIAEFGIEKYVKHAIDSAGVKRPCRIGACRLRGRASFGFITHAPTGTPLGQDMTEWYGAEKYEPPEAAMLHGGDNARNPANFPKYDGPERWQDWKHVFEPNELVVISEKIHGRNCRAGLIHTGEGVYTFHGGSNNCNKHEFTDERRSPYWAGINDQTKAALEFLSCGTRDVVIYGEVFGAGMQDLTYGQPGISFRAFDIAVNGVYMGYDEFLAICAKFAIPTVPVLYVGPYSDEKVLELTDGNTTFVVKQVREGVVVKPVIERKFAKRGGWNRLILKSVSVDYLTRRGGTEAH
jgi:RNA ligase (TIGR02306 family)